ncbi:testis-expressed protein 15 isoform X2 [Rhinoderma darwinii]|uniref:testis-expressed protein 15 isoform X2 n=1 Tax=Rhinoderma darwinii TaxID=43563 RepID=UPI003F66AC23
MEHQAKASFGTKNVENKLLQNFTIPKIKRGVDKFCLLHCTPNRREFGDIMDTLTKGRLNLASELSSWIFSEIKLVVNNHLTEKFLEKRNEMKELGRHGRELEDKYCFLVVPNQAVTDIAQHGLSVGSAKTKELGNPEMGVYLFRHIDVALNFANWKKMNSNVIFIFKVLFGKIKTVQPGSSQKSVLDPTPNFDCHISRKVPLWSDPFEEQVTNSLIYVYEYDSSFKPSKTPRQCLPIAAVDANFLVNKTVAPSVLARLPSKPISSGNTTLANCTVVKRIGKGKEATVIFKSVHPPLVETSEVELNQNNVSDKEVPSIPVTNTEQSCAVLEKSPVFQNNITVPDLSISLQQYNVALEGLIASCMVITSKSMKDPRLLKRSDQETVEPVGQQNQHSVVFENEVSCNIENNPSKEDAGTWENSINKTSLYLSFEERRLHDSIAMTSFVKKLKKYSSFLNYSEKEKDSDIESLPNIFGDEKAEHSTKLSLYNKLFDTTSNELTTKKSPEKEFADSMSPSTSNFSNETSENGVKSVDNRRMSNPIKNKDTGSTLYLSSNSKESMAGIAPLLNTSCEENMELPKKLCSNDKLYKICSSQQTRVFDFMSLDYTREATENGGKSEDRRCMSPKPKNKDSARTLGLSLNEKEREAGIVSLPNSFSEEKTELPKKVCSNDKLYKICASQLETKKSHVSDFISLDYSKKTGKNGGISESDRHISQKLKNKDTARASFKEKYKIKSLPNISSEEKVEHSKKVCKHDRFYKIHTNQIRAEKNQQTQVSESKSLNTLNYTRKINECVSKKTKPRNKDTASSSFLSCNENEKDEGIKSLPKTSSLQTQVEDSSSLTTLSSNENRGKSRGNKCISQHTMLKNKAAARKTSLIDYYKNQVLRSKKMFLKDRFSVANKTKLLMNGKESVTGIKIKRSGPDKDRIYKATQHHTREKVTQNKKSQGQPVKNPHKIPTETNMALHYKKPASIDDIPNPHKFVSTSALHEKIKYQKAKVRCKKSEKERRELYVPKDVTEKAEEYKKVTTATSKQITSDRHDDIYTLESLTDGLYTKTANEKDSFVLHSSDKISSENRRREECRTKSLHPMQSSSIVLSPAKACLPSTDLDVVAKDICIDKAQQSPHSKKMRNQAMAFPKNTLEDVSGEDLCFVTELENHIDWNGIFGMELEKVNATPGTFQSSSLRREKEPSGLRVFPDMEITITNDHYFCADVFINNTVGEIQPSGKAMNKTFECFNDGLQDHKITDSVPGIPIATLSPILEDSENFLKDNLDPLSIKVDSSVQPCEKTLTYSQASSQTVVDNNLDSVKTLNKLELPTVMKRLNKKRIPSVLVKKSTRRIHKFSQSEENIKVVLGMLSDEIPKCRNKRISKKLDRAILHLRKAHKRVKKSLQLVAKAGQRRNLSKTSSVQENHSVNGKEQVESTSSQILQTEDSSPNMKAAEVQKSPTADRKCLTESTQVMINGASVQDSQQTKVDGSSATKISPPCKVTICSPENPEDHSVFSSVIVSDKENTVPVVSSLKSPSDVKEKHVVNCETIGKECLVRDGGRKRRHASKRMFSQVRKRSSSLTISTSKCSNEKPHTVNEKNQLKGKQIKEFPPMTSQGAETNSLLLGKLSDILQKANETDSLMSLQNCKSMCQRMIPTFVKAFEKKQRCVLTDVIANRRLFVKGNLKACFRCTLKPQAIEAFLELQMIMETCQFVENRMHYIEGRPTFRSLLWYDRSLYTELLTGESGYQQQSHFYLAFQEKLKLSSLDTLENHYDQLSEFLQAINEKDSCYYVYLKYKRELQECEDVLKNDSDHAAFSLSVPFSCGVHLGDTIDDLTDMQKSTLEIINSFINLNNKYDPGKKEHALGLLEVISAKIDNIKTSVSTSIQLSLFGIEHLVFDAAKVMAFNEKKKYGGQKTITKELMGQINSTALSKLYEVYCVQYEQPTNTKESPSSDIWNRNTSHEVFEKQGVFFFGKIIDQARCAESSVLKKMIQDCNQHLEFQSKCFQILQECVVDEVLIQEANVLDMAERQDKCTTLLKPEAVEAYVDLAMTYETLHFLNCLMASKRSQMRSRGLLWYDPSLFSDLISNQYRMESFLEGNVMPSAIYIIDSTISEIKSELEIISNCSNSVNYTYAFQIMTRELSELSELKSFIKSSQPAITTYINLSPFVTSLHYGNSLTELEYNYNQLSDYLGVLMSAPKKDLGKLAHTMKIMKTIEFIKVFVFTPEISIFDFNTCHVLHSRKKQSQALQRQPQEEYQMLNSQSTRKRILTKMSAEASTSSSPKKQKVLTSPQKASLKEKEKSQVKSDVRPKKLFEMLTSVPQHKDPHPPNKDCVKGSLKKKSKSCCLSSLKHRHEYSITASEVGRINGKDHKINPADQDIIKTADSFTSKWQEASATTDTFEFTVDSNDEPQADSTCVDTCYPESILSIGSDPKNSSKPSDVQGGKKVGNGFSEEKDSSLNDNMTSLSECSMNTSISDEQENTKQLNPSAGEQKEKDLNSTGTQELKGESTTWDSQSISTASGQYAPFPISANPSQYSLYCWYQNGNNTGGMTQGYSPVSYNTQQTNPYIQSSAFPVPNSYITNQPYPGFSGQMYSTAAPFGANLPYNYTDPYSSSNQNPVPIPYSYSSSVNTGWPWGSWQ